jgi:ABC-type microcin C transport system permease subunit YejE
MTVADKPVIISMKNSVQLLPVLRSYIPNTFDISLTKALTYNALYYQIQRVGIRAGFPGMQINF